MTSVITELDEPLVYADQTKFGELVLTSQVLRALEQKHLIERQVRPTDSRARSLYATGDGVTLANRANAAVEAVDRAFFGALGDDQTSLTSMLGRLAGR